MFSPMGNKKVLLQMKLGLEVTTPINNIGGKSRHVSMDMSQMSMKNGKLGSMDFTNLAKNIERKIAASAAMESGSVKVMNTSHDIKSAANIIASTSALEAALSHVGNRGVVLNRIMESTVRYRPDRDAIVLKVFQSTCIEYELFRNALYSTFWLQFSDDEYAAFIEYFDPNSNGFLNGYDFMIAFTRLGGIRKDREAIEVREKQEFFVKQSKEDEERKKLELERKMDIAANFNFTSDVRSRALAKLCDCAVKFDASHPSSPSVEGFHVITMKPYTFRELIKLTFNLKVDTFELGAILKSFDGEISETNPNINASDFLRYFLKLGFEGREKEKVAQRAKQAALDAQAIELHNKKIAEQNDKLLLQVDYNFTPNDEVNAMQKLQDASTKYDKTAPGSVSLDGFECECLDPGQFKDILRRVFNIQLTGAELGFLVQKYDMKKIGSVMCKPFLTDFFRLGQTMRHKLFSEQLEKQKKSVQLTKEKHAKKVLEVQNSETVRINNDFTADDLQAALDKLTTASIKYDKIRGVSLESFEPAKLTPLDFKKAVKRTFNLVFTPGELGAIIKYFDKDNVGMVLCADFLTTFTTLGASEKFKIRSEQLRAQREAMATMAENEQKKVLTLGSKVQYNVDFEATEEDKNSALAKITFAATKYDATHPSSLGLDGFERNAMEAGEFKELVRRTFNLKLTAAEVGAVFKMFDENDGIDYMPPATQIDCGEFLKYFLSLGFAERSKVHKEQLEKQRKENKDREEEHRRKVEEAATRVTFTVDKAFDEEDKENIMQKINHAAEYFDKNHPAAPSLEAFEVSHMPPGLFRENLKRVFNIQASPKEIGYLMTLFDKDRTGKIDSKEFMLKFQTIGKTLRGEKRKAFLAEKRAAEKAAKKEEEDKLDAQWAKAELKVDYDCQASDYNSALDKMTAASVKYDKTHPSAPSLDGFSGGPIKPGVFRELMRRAFNVYFTPKELGAVVLRNNHSSDPNLVDGKVFLIGFMKLGYEARARIKSHTMEKQRKVHNEREQERERKLHLASQRNAIIVNPEFTEEDRLEAIKKIKAAAVNYDKNSPGSVTMEAFDAAYLTPGMFKEVLKRSLNINFTEPELASMLSEYDNGRSNVNTQAFMVSFIKLGTDERDKVKAIQLTKQRRMNYLRKTEHERKMAESEEKMTLSIEYDYTEEERESAFAKLAFASKKYDKSHPGSMSLDGFEEKHLKAHVFREMLKRTFNVILTNEELASVMHYFDKKRTGTVFSKKFLIYFLKVGITEREKDHRASMQKLREDAINREKEETEKLAAQWAKIELNLSSEFSPEERLSALEKLEDAALKFDPASPGPMGLTAFEAQYLSPAIFREMLKRSFNMKVTQNELAALVAEFDVGHNKKVDCKEFMVRFTSLGFGKRATLRTAQLNKQRTMTSFALEEMMQKQAALDSKLEAKLDLVYSDEDIHSALEKIRIIAANYDRAHASAPSLEGFMGTNMKPNEFKDMLMRTFHVALTPKELTAIANYFPVVDPATIAAAKRGARGSMMSVMSQDPNADSDLVSESGESRSTTTNKPTMRVNNTQFLIHFNKIQREEQSKRRKERIQKERDLIRLEEQEKKDRLMRTQQTEITMLRHTMEDELTLVDKIRHAAQEYAVDSALYTGPLQGFKGPALPSRKFQDLFRQIFNIKLTFPELGVLLSILDIGGIGTFDGTRFLNWFYRLSRVEEQILLGLSDEIVTIDTLRVTVQRPGTTTSVGIASGNNSSIRNTPIVRNTGHPPTNKHPRHTLGATPEMSIAEESEHSVTTIVTKSAMKSTKPHAFASTNHTESENSHTSTTSPNKNSKRYPYFFEDEFSADEGELGNQSGTADSQNANSFTKSTLEKAWFLPSLTGGGGGSAVSPSKAGLSRQPSKLSRQSSSLLLMPVEDHTKYLSDIFSATVETADSVLSKSIDGVEAELNRQLIAQLVGSNMNKTQIKSSKLSSSVGKSMTKQQARQAQQAADYLTSAKNKTIKSLNNDMVYGSLSSTGKLSAILTHSTDDSLSVAKQHRLSTAPAASNQPQSPLSGSQLLAPLITADRDTVAMSRTMDSADFNTSVASSRGIDKKHNMSYSQSLKSHAAASPPKKRANASLRPEMNTTSQSNESVLFNPRSMKEKPENDFLHDFFAPYAQDAAEQRAKSLVYREQLAARTAPTNEDLMQKLEQVSKQLAMRPQPKHVHIHPIGKQKRKQAPSSQLDQTAGRSSDQSSTVLMDAAAVENLLAKPVESPVKPVVKPKEPSSDAGFFFPVLLSSLTPVAQQTSDQETDADGVSTSPMKPDSSSSSTVLRGVPDIGPSGLLIARSTTQMLNGGETAEEEGVSRDQLRDIFNMVI